MRISFFFTFRTLIIWAKKLHEIETKNVERLFSQFWNVRYQHGLIFLTLSQLFQLSLVFYLAWPFLLRCIFLTFQFNIENQKTSKTCICLTHDFSPLVGFFSVFEFSSIFNVIEKNLLKMVMKRFVYQSTIEFPTFSSQIYLSLMISLSLNTKPKNPIFLFTLLSMCITWWDLHICLTFEKKKKKNPLFFFHGAQQKRLTSTLDVYILTFP